MDDNLGTVRCVVLEKVDRKMSFVWKKIDLTGKPVLKVYAGVDIPISDPPQVYILRCTGGSVPDGATATAVSAKWVDSGAATDIQTTTTTIAKRTDLISTPTLLTVTMAKFYATPG